MEIDWLYKDKIEKHLEFNDENGKYEKKIGKYKIELNSWNLKINILEKDGEVIQPLPSELIKIIIDINDDMRIRFEEEKEKE